MKTSLFLHGGAALGLALLFGGCASSRSEPIWVCGHTLTVIEDEPAAAKPTPAAKIGGGDESIVLGDCFPEIPEPRKRAEAAVMY